jgi:DnaK suppressor protein
MDPKKREVFRGLLNEELGRLISEAEEGVVQLVEEKENLPDSIDLATSESDRDFSLRMKDRDRKLIFKIRDALRRLEEDDYGYCVICGEEIGFERLKARPVTTHCIDCKTEAEMQERVRGA